MEYNSPTEEMLKFFDTIWGSNEGFVYTPTKDPQTNEWRKIFWEWPKHRDVIPKQLIAATARGLEVYCAPALFKEAKAVKEAVKGSSVLWCDFDGNAPDTWPEDSKVPEPTLRIQSSLDKHQHAYWRLDEFCPDVSDIEDRNRSIAYTIKADVSGWDCNQILRPPGTTNWKRNLAVTTRNISDNLFNLNAFAAIPRAIQLVDDNIDLDDLPNIEKVVAKYKWDDAHYELYKSHVEDGHRHYALMRLGYFCAEAGMTDSEMYCILENADSRWKKFVGRADRHRRLLDIVNRARLKHPVGMEELSFRGLLGNKDEVVLDQGKMIYGFKEFIDSELNIEWAIEGLLEKGGFGMCAGAPGVGKTQLSIQLGIAAALGIPFLGWNIPKPQKVLFLSLEMSYISLKFILSTIIKQYTEEQIQRLNENFIIVPLGQPIYLEKPEGLKFIETLFSEINPDGVIVDSMSRLNSKLSDDTTVIQLNGQYRKLRSKYGPWLWFIHHNRKSNENNKKPTSLDDIYGSVFITAEMTSCFVLWKEKGNTLIDFIPVKTRLSREVQEFKLKRNDNLYFEDTRFEDADTIIENLVGNVSKFGFTETN